MTEFQRPAIVLVTHDLLCPPYLSFLLLSILKTETKALLTRVIFKRHRWWWWRQRSGIHTQRILGECLLIFSLPGKASRTLVDIARLAEIWRILGENLWERLLTWDIDGVSLAGRFTCYWVVEISRSCALIISISLSVNPFRMCERFLFIVNILNYY